jgi:hypothetical protein
MDQQEQAFLSAALSAGDERLEQRLFVGFHLVRDCCRLADNPKWVPRTRVAREALDAAVAGGTFEVGELEHTALTCLLHALEEGPPPQPPGVYASLVEYVHALYRESNFTAAKAALDVTDALWTPECHPRDRLEAAYLQSLIMIRGPHERAASSSLPLLLAVRARAECEVEFVALAGSVHHIRTLLSGNLPLTIREGEKRLRQLRRHPSVRAEGTVGVSIAAAHGRAGRPAEVLRVAGGLLDVRHTPYTKFAALNLAGVAFTELGELEAARAAFEMMLLGPTSNSRRIGALGLMDLHARRLERNAFERIYRYLTRQPFSIDGQIHFWQTAGRGWARLGDAVHARRCFDEAYLLARRCGLSYEILETEDLIEKLPDPEQQARAADIAPAVAANVTVLRDANAEAIAACLT